MRPIQLVMNDFGPYKGRNVIDFSSIQNALFLISGPTGAGKTYIFDAICFALYGKLSGETRKEEDIRSSFAPSDSVAYVEFTFSYQGHEYVIYREPAKQLIVAKRKTKDNQGLKEKTAEYYLKKDHKTLFTKKKEIDDYIKNLLCLDYQQFKMTMMIAQGDFYRLITADTDTRKEIFRQILNTVSLDRFATRLGEMVKEKASKIETIQIQLQSAFQHLKLNDEILMKEIVRKDVEYMTLLESIEASIHEDEKQIGKYQEQEDLLQKELEALNEQIRKIEKDNLHFSDYQKHVADKENLLEKKKIQDQMLVPYLTRAEIALPIMKKELEKEEVQKEFAFSASEEEKMKQQLQTLLARKKELEPQIQELLEEEKGYEDLLSSIQQLMQEEQQLEQFLNLKKEVERLASEKDALLKDEESDRQFLREIIDRITELESWIAEQNYEEEKQQLLLRKQELEKEISTLENLAPLLKKLENLLKEKDELASKVRTAFLDEQNAMKEYQEKNHHFLSSLSASLAKDLKDNEPCPVCGSLSHPCLASATNIVTKEEKEEAEKEHREKEKIYLDLVSDEKTLIIKIDALKQQIIDALGISKNDDVKDCYQNQLSKLRNELDHQVIHRLDEIASLEKEIKDKKDEIIKLKEKQNKMNEEIEVIKKKEGEKSLELAKKEGELSSLEKGIRFFDIQVIHQELEEKKAKKDRYEMRKKDIEEKKKQLDTSITSLEAKCEVIKKQKDSSACELKELDEELSSLLLKSIFKDMDEVKQAYANEEQIKQYSNEILVLKTQIEAAEQTLNDEKEKGYDKLLLVDINPFNSQLAMVEQNKKEILENKATLLQQIRSNKKELSEIHQIMKETKDLQEEYQEILLLSKTAKGDLNNTNKICFEVYYQLQVFSKVLEVASQKFHQMSGGRYMFSRSTASSKKKQSGLEINVIDSQYGIERSASSLSGGESFQASLSLALSFSEVIQAFAGGIELNSMFIDEGFGTLDEDMLRTTEKTLMGISNSTDRLVGIISHIDELQESIPSKIVVTKTDHGSKVRIEND